MTQLLSRSSTAQVIDKIEDVLKLTIYERLAPSQVDACRAHLDELKKVPDDFDIAVNFETIPEIRQTRISFVLTPKAKALQ